MAVPACRQRGADVFLAILQHQTTPVLPLKELSHPPGEPSAPHMKQIWIWKGLCFSSLPSQGNCGNGSAALPVILERRVIFSFGKKICDLFLSFWG